MYCSKIGSILMSLVVLTACGGGKSNSDSSDSLLQKASEDEEIIVSGREITELPMLPDTAFASVSLIKFNVETVDASIDPVISSTADLYADIPGAFTFRKGSRRDANFGGSVKGKPSTISIDWTFKTDYRGTWGGGTGWTGQPLYVEWPDSCINRFRQANLVNDNFNGRELMFGSLCGKVYFLDFETGNPTRTPIDGKNPIKGTISLDPTLNGNLYVGQGIADSRPFGAYVIDLYRHDITHMFPEDPKAGRKWGAYDSSPVRVGRFLMRPGENGTLYKFYVKPGELILQSALRYTVNGHAPGMEASMSVYSNYGFTCDNDGTIVCVNLNTMRPVWCYALGDDTDSSPVLLVEDGHPYIYTGCEIDQQVDGTANFVKLDALNGEVIWRTSIPGRRAEVGEKHFDGGFYSTSLPGTGNCKNLLMVNCVLNTSGHNGQFMAFDRNTGDIVYTTPLKHYAWSSPVGFLNENGEMYVFAADCSGYVYLINGADGNVIFSTHVGNNFESSPVVVGNSLVVGSRGETIYKMSFSR